MGFIEKITQIMQPGGQQPAATEPAAEPDKADSVIEESRAAATDENANGSVNNIEEDDKQYSKEEVQRLLEEERKTLEMKQFDNLSKETQIEQLKAELFKRDIKEKVFARIEEARLPLGVAEFVQYTDEAGTMASVESVVKTVGELVQAGIKERLRGKIPAGLGRASQNENSIADPFAKAFMDAMNK